MRIRRIVYFALLLLGLHTAANAQQCGIEGGRSYMIGSVGTVVDVGVGQTLTTVPAIKDGTSWIVSCPSNSSKMDISVNYGLYETNYPDVYTISPNSKYGVRIRYNGTVISIKRMTIATFTPGSRTPWTPANVTIEIVKVRDTGSDLTDYRGASLATAGFSSDFSISFGTIGGTTPPTCSVTTSSIKFSLGDVNASTLGSVGATSPTSGTQNVSLSCKGNPPVRMTLQGTRATDGPVTTLALTPGTSVAQGVGVQLLYNNNPLSIGTAQTVSNAAGTSLNIPIAARYYRTGDITAGTANSTATLQFTYN